MKKFVFFPSMLSENINAERRNVIDRFAACLTPIRVSRRLNDNGGTSDTFQNSITRQSPRTIPSRLLETWPRLLQSIAVSRIGNRFNPRRNYSNRSINRLGSSSSRLPITFHNLSNLSSRDRRFRDYLHLFLTTRERRLIEERDRLDVIGTWRFLVDRGTRRGRRNKRLTKRTLSRCCKDKIAP